MDLDQKIDYLTDNIIALAGQTEKRAKNAELLISQAIPRIEYSNYQFEPLSRYY